MELNSRRCSLSPQPRIRPMGDVISQVTFAKKPGKKTKQHVPHNPSPKGTADFADRQIL